MNSRIVEFGQKNPDIFWWILYKETFNYTIQGCGTKNGPVAKKPCVFPFNYNDISYTKCTRDHHDQPWCSTEVDGYGKHVKGKWGNCDSNCGTGIASFGSLSRWKNMKSVFFKRVPHTGFFWKFSFGNSNVGINEFWCKIGLKTWESTSVH